MFQILKEKLFVNKEYTFVPILNLIMNGVIPEKWTVKFHNFLHILKAQDNQGQSAHEFDYKTPQYIL
ncbi:hypothetical protein JCM31447_31430 (plasmid) [Fluviispira sanaruensis]|uniref:Uncharacterized protein n=1 Tax=Fluviispira sanaruensis TaxID=2493639 RepID=A0A4P2VR61_FLUSA|nr:hypothetical protein JCM31447_31430 [Fluviispira sanaruensis]